MRATKMRTKKPHTFSWGRKNKKKKRILKIHIIAYNPIIILNQTYMNFERTRRQLFFQHSSRYIKYNISIGDSDSEFLFPAHQSNV